MSSHINHIKSIGLSNASDKSIESDFYLRWYRENQHQAVSAHQYVVHDKFYHRDAFDEKHVGLNSKVALANVVFAATATARTPQMGF